MLCVCVCVCVCANGGQAAELADVREAQGSTAAAGAAVAAATAAPLLPPGAAPAAAAPAAPVRGILGGTADGTRCLADVREAQGSTAPAAEAAVAAATSTTASAASSLDREDDAVCDGSKGAFEITVKLPSSGRGTVGEHVQSFGDCLFEACVNAYRLLHQPPLLTDHTVLRRLVYKMLALMRATVLDSIQYGERAPLLERIVKLTIKDVDNLLLDENLVADEKAAIKSTIEQVKELGQWGGARELCAMYLCYPRFPILSWGLVRGGQRDGNKDVSLVTLKKHSAFLAKGVEVSNEVAANTINLLYDGSHYQNIAPGLISEAQVRQALLHAQERAVQLASTSTKRKSVRRHSAVQTRYHYVSQAKHNSIAHVPVELLSRVLVKPIPVSHVRGAVGF